MAHDPYDQFASTYDFAYGDYAEDILFYENLARAAPEETVLELGVGTGRVAIQLAKAGFRVMGLDRSHSMLERAEENAKRANLRRGALELVRGEMVEFSLDRRFGMVLIAANTFQHLLTREEQLSCLQCTARHLVPGGIFAMSVRSPTSVSWEDAGTANPVLHDWTRRDPQTGEIVQKFVSSEPDPARMTRRITYFYDRIRDGVVHREVFEADLRYSTAAELEALLQDAGLRVTHLYGDYDLSPVGQATELLIFVARAEDPR